MIACVVLAGLVACGKEAAAPSQPTAEASPPRDWTVPAPEVDGFQEPVAAAIENARRNVLTNPRSSKAWFLLAATLDAHKLYVEAEHCYDNAVALDPTDHFALYNYAMMLDARQDRVPDAIAMFEQAGSSMADYAPVWHHLGRLYQQQGELEKAREVQQRALSMYPDLPALRYDLGQTLLLMGRIDEGLLQLERAAELLPNDASIHAALSRAYFEKGDQRRARAEAEVAAKHPIRLSIPDPVRDGVRALAMDSASLMRRGAWKMDRGLHAEAIPELEAAARYLTKNASLHLRLGICHFTTGQHQEARTYLQRTIELRDSMAQAHQFIGRIDAAEGNHASAAEWYRQAIEREPANAEHHVLLGEALEALGRREEAIAAYRRALEIDSNDSRARARLEALGAP